jgi:hypothetical protein
MTLIQRQRFASWVFRGAGVYGLIVLFPLYFLEANLAQDFPPPLTHPEHYYGFIGVSLSWQVAFLLIATDVPRYRLFMLPSVLEKLTFGIAALAIYVQGRAPLMVAGAGTVDLILGALFVMAFRATGSGTPFREGSNSHH